MARYFFYEDSAGLLVYKGVRPADEPGNFLCSVELTRAEWVRLLEACPPGTVGLWTAAVTDSRSRKAN
jgi:hypothetical protein